MAIQTSVRTKEFRETIQESRQKFLNILCNSEELDDEKIRPNNESIKRKPASKKISFKVKKTSSTYRKNFNPKIEKTTIKISSVAEIASKFNQMIEINSVNEDDVKLMKKVKKLNSFDNKFPKQTHIIVSTNESNRKEQRRPSIKKKPVLVEEKNKVQIFRKKSVKTISSPRKIKEGENERIEISSEESKITAPGFVKAAIQNFEQKSIQPIITKRSLSEYHLKPTINVDENRRKSCKPDLNTSIFPLHKNEEFNNDKSNSKSEPNLVLPHQNLFDVKLNDFPSQLNLRTSSVIQENEKNEESEELSYSVKDIENRTLTEIEQNKNDFYEENEQNIKPNSSFLWTRGSSTSKFYHEIPEDKSLTFLNVLNKTHSTTKELIKEEIYEELDNGDGYEPFDITTNYEEIKLIDDTKKENEYEYFENNEENIYETLPSPPREELSTNKENDDNKNDDSISNCYESIYNSSSITNDNNYESIYFRQSSVKHDNSEKDIAGSIVSSEQKTNSLYGTSLRSWLDGNVYSNGSTPSDISFSDKSEWIDVSENEDDGHPKIIIVKETAKSKKNSTSWSQQYRQQWSKNIECRSSHHDDGIDSDSDHHYETLQKSEDEHPDFVYDSFESDVDSDDSFENLENNDNLNLPLPAVPNSNDVLTRLAASASKHMRKFTKNLSMTRNDISKSLTRITRRKSKSDVNEIIEGNGCDNTNNESSTTVHTSEINPTTKSSETVEENNEKNKSLSRKGFLNRIRRSIIMSPEQASEITSHFNNNKSKSTFYLTPTINVDDPDDDVGKKTEDDSGISLSPVERDRNSKNKLIRPQNPPPPAPLISLNEDLKKAFKEKRSTTWYAEVDLCKTSETKQEKQRNTCWYDEIGLYQKSASTPSTSSAENSGTNTNITISTTSPTSYSNQSHKNKNYSNNYYNGSIKSDTKKDFSLSSLPGEDIQMMLQNEPLYQFYDAAVLESVYSDGISDFDSDNYEDFERRAQLEHRPSPRPSAMELIVPKRNSLAFSKTLWCEIPEVLQSSVLSTLSSHQKKLQEAKFEMVTSEASYLNSLNVLNDHFIQNLRSSLNDYEFDLIFGKIEAVRKCSDELLLDLEKCWQDNILLHGVCDIIQKHAEENFSVYISYCENHMLLDKMMKKLKERPTFVETLKQLESSPICQCLSLYSFLMLPMQRITRWPLLLDAVLKRLEQHDPEYITCQYVLATINKIVSQCNEAARNKERELEMLTIESKMEFAKGVPPFDLVVPNRWLVRSGNVTHMQPKSEEIKLTFGKKISKVTLHLFLFNDLLVVSKPKSDNTYSVLHYCSRNFTELSTSDQLLSIPGKDMTGKYLFFLTILENQNKKTVEFLLSCSSESDKQRWIEALSPPKSEDPDEVLYECWDCPQVTVIHNYAAVQPDELSLSKGDVINVSRKMADGWYQGERIRDGQSGWFPSNYAVEIANPHVRARNLKQRYRLLTFSENYLKNK